MGNGKPTPQEIRVSRVIMTTGPLTPRLAEIRAGALANLKPGSPEWLLEKAESADALAALPVVWQFKADPKDRGEQESWFNQAPDASWADVRVDDFWTRQLPERYLGVGWYAVAFDVPAAAPGRKLYLRFGAVDGDARVWIDGTLAGVQDRPPAEMWDRPFALDVTTLLKPGMRQRFAVRVSKVPGPYEEGIWKPVELRAGRGE